MRHRRLTLTAAAAALAVAGCGSGDDDNDRAATSSTPTVVTQPPTITTVSPGTTTTRASDPDDELSPRGRAVLAETQDLAGDVSDTAEAFANGDIDDDEAMARLELARDRADELADRAQKLPVADRARSRLASMNEEISRTADDVSRLVASGRAASRKEIADRIGKLRDDARSTYDAVRDQLDDNAQERLNDALDRIGG